MSKQVLYTKFGIAKIDREYYRISSSKEGNYHKYLHRLIFEDFYGCEILENRFEHLGWEVVHNYKLRPKGQVNGKKRYCIRYKGKVLKQSTSKERLIKWFKKTYPNEELEISDTNE